MRGEFEVLATSGQECGFRAELMGAIDFGSQSTLFFMNGKYGFYVQNNSVDNLVKGHVYEVRGVGGKTNNRPLIDARNDGYSIIDISSTHSDIVGTPVDASEMADGETTGGIVTVTKGTIKSITVSSSTRKVVVAIIIPSTFSRGIPDRRLRKPAKMLLRLKNCLRVLKSDSTSLSKAASFGILRLQAITAR